jgi:APA family basic amino acid/polyamine antiporter
MTQHIDLSRNEENLKRTITLPQALGIAFHQIVGGGVVSLTGIAIGLTGGGVALSFVLAAAGIIIMSIPYSALGAAMPVTGGQYTYATRLIHPGAGYFAMMLAIMTQVSLSLYGLTAGAYLHALNPWFNETFVAIALLSTFYVANMLGAAFSARIGLVLAGIMLVAFGLFIVFGLMHTDFANYPPVLPNGFSKMLQAAALLTFATGGGTVVAEMGREMKNPGKVIPLAVIGGTAFAAVLYLLIALPAAGVLPIAEVANQPLSVVAKAVMPGALPTFFILGGAVIAVIGTLNTQLMWGSKSLLVAIDDGWFPRKLGSVNKRFGTPHFLLTILFLVGIIPAVAHIDVSVIASAASAVSQLMFITVMICSLRLRKLFPELHAAAPFKLNGTLHKILAVAAIAICLYQTYLLSQGLSTAAVISMLVWIAVAVVYFFIRYPYVKMLGRARKMADDEILNAETITMIDNLPLDPALDKRGTPVE